MRYGEGKRKKGEERLKTLGADRIDLETVVKEFAEKLDKEGKEIEKEIVQLKESDKKNFGKVICRRKRKGKARI